MNRLVLVLCVVVIASYAALASYLVWPTLVYEHGGSRSALNIPTSVANRGEIRKDGSSPTGPTSPVRAAYEAPTKPVAPAANWATSDYEQGKIASQETQEQRPSQRVSVKRYAKAFPVQRHANSVRSKKSSHVKQVAVRPIRGRTEMASLLQRAFSGY